VKNEKLFVHFAVGMQQDVGVYVASIPNFQMQITWSIKSVTQKLDLRKFAIDYFILDQKILAVRVSENIVTFHFDANHSNQVQKKAKKTARLRVVRVENGIDNCMC
jgi:hypothetical protein